MFTKTAGRVPVPGATLYYEVTGRGGPVLLLIAGGGTDAAIFDGIVPQLAAQYTVVCYDPRGNSRSPYDDAPADESVSMAAEDALAVLDAIGCDVPAYVFGSSTGAITAMELLVRHPDRIRLLIAHEPPAIELLPDATSARAFFHEFPERMEANDEIFSTHKLLPFTSYIPDVAALVALEDKFVPAVGSESSKILPAEPILALADRVGWDVIAFPGGHGGYASHPFEFATLLHRVLTGALR
ncbi:alpha/beta hydrolase [Kribbella sp. NPDC056861]|uniref:alpha/beta fold hydrolase n=1 Tax=Kribbella sp. NPDC056861 TaxID=3154857 RepID=UPI003436059D